MMRLDAIVLDLDDTLYDSTRLLLPWADRRAAAAMVSAGLDLAEDEILRCIVALREAGRTAVFADLVRDAGGPDRAVAAAEAAWFDYAPPPMSLEPDVERALDDLAALAPLALLTTGHPDTQRRKVERLGIAPRFVECRIVDFRDPAGKTAALGDMIRAHAWNAAHTVMVGDRPDGDVRAGNRNGCRTVLVRAAGGENARVAPASADDVPWGGVTHVREVAGLLRAAATPP